MKETMFLSDYERFTNIITNNFLEALRGEGILINLG